MRSISRQPVFIASVIASSLMVLVDLFGWMLGYGFLVPPDFFLSLIAGLCFVFVLCWSLTHAIHGIYARDFVCSVPLSVNIAAIVILWAAGWMSLPMRTDFWVNYPRRMQVVRMVENGTLKPNVTYGWRGYGTSIKLSPAFRSLSDSGDVELIKGRPKDGIVILFTTNTGFLDPDFSGFVYKSNGGSLISEDIGGKLVSATQLASRWFYVEGE
jgi:hypothetical protein